MKAGKIFSRILTAVCLCVYLFPLTVFAETGGNEKSYTYTVTLYAGNQGSFAGADGVSVSGSGQVSYADGNQIQITGLKYGDRLTVSAVSGMVALHEESKYYVKGIRESGKDNNTVGNPSFAVDSDREYVVAYGIRGNMVSYQVHYVDGQGNELYAPQTFYGAVGDRPVVAFQYIDGYQPQAYNLTGTLGSNEADNIFTFVYSPIRQTSAGNGEDNAGTQNQETASGTEGGDAQTGTAGGTGTAAAGTAGTGTAGAGTAGTGTAGAGTAGTGDAAADGTTAETGNAAADDTTAETAEESGEAADAGGDMGEETPEELVNIDDEDTPLGQLDIDQKNTRDLQGICPGLLPLQLWLRQELRGSLLSWSETVRSADEVEGKWLR